MGTAAPARALAALALAGLAAPGAAHATFAGSNGGLAVVLGQVDRTGYTGRLDLRAPGGRLSTLLVCNTGDNNPTGIDDPCAHDPAFSLDGERIAFALGGRLAVANADGSARIDLPALTEQDQQPAWAPDGERLVFTGGPPGRRALYVVNSDGSGLRRLTRGHAPSWSEGNRIAYVAGDRLRLIRPDGRGRQTLQRGRDPDWFPSAAGLAYSWRRRIYTLRVLGPRPRRPHLLVRRGHDPVFSPDGTRVAFVRPTGDAEGDIYTIGLYGRGLRRVYRARGPDYAFNFASDPAWRPGPPLACAPKVVFPAQNAHC